MQYELIDGQLWPHAGALPASWISEQTRSRATDPLQCIGFGKYVRFAWQSLELEAWLAGRLKNIKPIIKPISKKASMR